jgi:putative Mn2+ efflux pump MntP
MIGKRFAALLDNKAEILGGVVLILIGARILFTHLV